MISGFWRKPIMQRSFLVDKTYREMVDEKLSTNSSEIFGNFSPEHAGYIIAQFISKAQRSIEILSGSFADTFYEGIDIEPLLKQAADRLQSNNGQIRIITINGERCNKLEAIANRINGENRQVIAYIPAQCNDPDKVNHFMVVDDRLYRLEELHEVKPEGQTPECVKAEVCCNGPQKAAALRNRFDTVWNQISSPQE